MAHPLVVHRKSPHDVYVGRPSGPERDDHFGNPFSHLPNSRAVVTVASREEAVRAYDDWLAGDPKWAKVKPNQRLWVLAHISDLKGKVLGCWCAPKLCHGEVLARRAETMPEFIGSFQGEYAFLSNFYPYFGGGQLVPRGREILHALAQRLHGYPTMEHMYQAHKTLDIHEREFFKDFNMTPGQAKRRGRLLVIRADWEDVKEEVMLEGLRLKFARGTKAAEMLLATGSAMLVEGNLHHDDEWGSCNCPQHRDRPGKNKLGRLLMEVRGELRR